MAAKAQGLSEFTGNDASVCRVGVKGTSETDHQSAEKPSQETEAEKDIPRHTISALTLALLFCVLFLPMLTIPFVLLGLVSWRRVNFVPNGTADLPVSDLPPSSYYYTEVSPAKFALVSSWASTVEGHITAPFLILFSFFIAWTMRRAAEKGGSYELNNQSLAVRRVRTLLQSRSLQKLWNFLKAFLPWRTNRAKPDGATVVAISGLAFTLVFASLIIAGDNWLHFYVQSMMYRYYDAIYTPELNTTSGDSNDPNSPVFDYAAGYVPLDSCSSFLDGTAPADTLPCSLNTSRYYNVANPSETYLVLEAGISSTPTDFSSVNFSQVVRDQYSFTASGDQVITYFDSKPNLNHSLLFYLDAAYQYSIGNDTNIGYDYVAPTHSMQTTCTSITKACSITPDSTLYDCSPIFSGDLSSESTTGRYRIPGWNTTFYTLDNGTAREISTTEDQNPFHFNLTAQVDTISDVLEWLSDPSTLNASQSQILGELLPGVVRTGDGTIAFALSCTSTVYDVTYSMINASISHFHAVPASPKLASIVRAPLQVGYGRYNLYQAATLAVIGTTFSGAEPLNSSIARSFSQVAVALSSGAFGYTTNLQQRERRDRTVTQVPKAPVWFLAVVCMLYALVSLGVFIGAFLLRRDEDVKEVQRRLGLEDAEDALNESLGAVWGLAKEKVKGEAADRGEDFAKTEAKALMARENR